MITAYSESGDRASGKVIFLKRRARTAEASVMPAGEIAIQFTDE
ncbi:MAG TPA: hypothetical protein VMM76_01000 [Pirellulaceae bacterium]|nr:hypothetical protein [Pirellulaceae bacterium]